MCLRSLEGLLKVPLGLLEALEEVLEVLEEVPEEVLVPVFPVGSPWDAKKWLGEKPNF